MAATVRTLRKLESAGFDREQAEALVEAFDADLDHLATKADLYRALLVQTLAIAGLLIAAFQAFG